MQHQFFNHHSSLAQLAANHASFVPRTYDLKIQNNAIANGIPVEADESGSVVAVTYPSGQRVRNHFHYMIGCSGKGNYLMDRNQFFHPLD